MLFRSNTCLGSDATIATAVVPHGQNDSDVVGVGAMQSALVTPQTMVTGTEPTGITNADGGIINVNTDERPIVLHGQNGILSNDEHVPSSNLEVETDDGGGHYALVEEHIDRVCIGEGSPGIPSYNWNGAWHDGKQEVKAELTELWTEIFSNEGDLKLYERVLLFCELPFTVLRKVCLNRLSSFVINMSVLVRNATIVARN